MREGWEYKKIKEVCSFIGDGDWIESKDQSDFGIRLIQTGNIGTGIYRDKADKVKYISNATFSQLSCTEIFEGDCLLSRLPDPIGRSCLLPKLNVRTITAVDCTILRFKDDVLPIFFVYYTQSNSYYKDILSKTTGTTRKRISRKNLEKIGIPIPPKPTQLSIVSELDKLNELIQIKKEQLKDYDTLAQSIFYEMFGDPVENEKGWEVKKIGDVCKTSSGGTPSKAHDEYYNGDILWLRSGEVGQGDIYDTEQTITLLGLENSSAKIFPVNTVVIAMYGATVGQVGILRKEMSTNQAICGILPNGVLTPEYLNYFLLRMKSEFLKLAIGGAQANISQQIIRKTLIPLPPLSLQKYFTCRIRQIEQQKAAIQKTITDLETLLAARMQYWFD